MSLTAALRAASAALATNAAQSAVVARNVSNAGDADWSRRTAVVVSRDGAAQSVSIERAADPALRAAMLSATSGAAASGALSDGLDRLNAVLGDATGAGSPAALIGSMAAALQSFAASPSDASLGGAAIGAAQALADGLNDASATVQSVRGEADAQMAQSVARINSLLADLDKTNSAVVAGTRIGADVGDAQDARDATLKALSNEIGVTTVAKPDGGVAVYADGGATLFDGGLRLVSMKPTKTFVAGSDGAAVVVDGVPVTGRGAVMPAKTGALAGLATLRDSAAPTLQTQLDGLAAGLVSAFAEADAAGATRPGLFTWPGAPALPGAGQTAGIAASLSVAAGATAAGLRDGSIAGASANAAGSATFAARLNALGDALDATRAFDPAGKIATSATLADYAAQSSGWLSAARQAATGDAASRAALATQASQVLSNAVGVNLDDQMSRMLDLENAYQASAKLMSAANGMFQALFQAVGA